MRTGGEWSGEADSGGGRVFPDVIVAGIVVALLRGGRLTEAPRIRGAWILILVAIFQSLTPFLPQAGAFLMIGSYLLLLYLGYCNWESTAFRVLGVGTLLNALVIIANGGRMPVDLALAAQLSYEISGLTGDGFMQHVALHEGTRLGFLADIILLRFPIPRVISIGDIFAVVGLFLLIQEIFGKPVVLFGPAKKEGRQT